MTDSYKTKTQTSYHYICLLFLLLLLFFFSIVSLRPTSLASFLFSILQILRSDDSDIYIAPQHAGFCFFFFKPQPFLHMLSTRPG